MADSSLKKSSVFLFLLCAFAFAAASCSLFGGKTGAHSDDAIQPFPDEEEIDYKSVVEVEEPYLPLEEIDGSYTLDLSKFYFWQKTEGYGSMEAVENEPLARDFTFNAKWSGGAVHMKNFDASEYNYIRIDYYNASDSFRLKCNYADESALSEYQRCEKRRKTQYCALNQDAKNNITSISFQAETDTLSFRVRRICLVKEKKLSPKIVDSSGSAVMNTSVSAVDFVKKMKVGWNLANTLEAHSFSWQENPCLRGLDAEFDWGVKVETSLELLKFGRECGYKTIRIPVTWYNHIIDENYTIDPDWMARVKRVVDYAMKTGYYVILNEHHSVHGDLQTETTQNEDGSIKYSSRAMNRPLKYADGYIVSGDAEDQAESKRFLKAVWTQIATAFNTSYGNRLIFETMNEPRNARDDHVPDPKGRADHEWEPGLKCAWYKADGSIGGYWCDATECQECLQEYEVLNEYNQVCLDAIRATGGNNASRFVMIPAPCTGIEPALKDNFKMPTDSAKDRLILTVHKYCPVSEGGVYTEQNAENLHDAFSRLNEKFISKGIPVVVGETGAEKEKISLAERIKWITNLASEAGSFGMSIIYWDCGTKDAYMAEIDRKNLVIYEPDFVNAMMQSIEQ